MELSDLQKIRLEKLRRLEADGIPGYPTRAHVTHSSAEATAAFIASEGQAEPQPVEVSVAGRLRSVRAMGKVMFAHIEDRHGRLQLFLRINELGEDGMNRFRDDFDLGDFVEASGKMFRTRSGEISVEVHSYALLAKSITPLPAAKDEVVDGQVVRHAALNDPEARYRQRYADLAVNPDVREVFRLRAAIVNALREYLNSHDFLEVETPILQPIYGGAAARPFTTHHNQLKQDLFLRISFELYLKRLLVGGLERVYEIGRDFRNEGVSFKHNPEFTQLEFYMAYADYLKVMDMTEEMINFVCQRALGGTKFSFKGNEIDVSAPWRRVEMRQGLIEATGIDIHEHPTGESLEAAMQAQGYKFKPGTPRGKLIDGLVGDFLEPTFIQPTFMYNYPREISPLAKSIPGDPTTVERFEGFMGGMELCNAFTELNDPFDQEARFLEMGRAYASDDDESNPLDDDYLQAMLLGMPPCGGFGIGVDRLAMLLSGRPSIREVILFPHLRENEA